jgi:hypothetical protein
MFPGRWTVNLIVVLVVAAHGVSAHDPGLSTLEVRVGRTEIIALASLDPSDVRILSGGETHQHRRALGPWIRDAIHVRVDGHPLEAAIDEAAADATGVQVTLRFSRPAGSQVSIRSSIAERAGRGHRTLVSITDDRGRKIAERLTGATDPEVGANVERLAGSFPVEALRFLPPDAAYILDAFDYRLFLAGLLAAGWWFVERRSADVHRFHRSPRADQN